MTDLRQSPDPNRIDASATPDASAPPGVPRWVKVMGIIVLVLVLVFIILQVTGIGGQHSPGRHASLSPVTTHRLAQL